MLGDFQTLKQACIPETLLGYNVDASFVYIMGLFMLLNCGVGEDSWDSLGLQGDPTNPS